VKNAFNRLFITFSAKNLFLSRKGAIIGKTGSLPWLVRDGKMGRILKAQRSQLKLSKWHLGPSKMIPIFDSQKPFR
jgi:hypothetical protein